MLKLLAPKSTAPDLYEFKPLLAEIEERPLNPLGQTFFWTVVALLVCTVICMFVGEVDVVVMGRGKIIPQARTKILQALDAGMVRNILVKEGDYVKKGQKLIEIDASTSEPALDSFKQDLQYTQLEKSRLESQLANQPFAPVSSASDADYTAAQQRLYNSGLESISSKVGAKRQELQQITQSLESAQAERTHAQERLRLDKEQMVRMNKVKDIIAMQNYDNIQGNMMDHTNQLEAAQHRIQELQHRKGQVQDEIAALQSDFHSTLLQQLSEKQRHTIELNAQIKQASFRNTQRTIVSPVDGYIDELYIHTVGGVVTPAEKVLSIIPADSPLIVESVIQNRDIGFVKTGMPVSVKVDAYEFQKYGLIPGVITRIAADSHSKDDQPPAYIIAVELKKKYLKVNGKWERLETGMTVASEVKVGRRKVIEFFVYPLIKSLHTSVSVR